MFTGIIEEVGLVHSLKKLGDGIEFVVRSKKVFKALNVDNSICINGVCLTVVKKNKSDFRVQAVKETLRKTNLGLLKSGSAVNLERSVRLNNRLGGHLVQGHVDTTGTVSGIKTLESSWMYTISFPKKISKKSNLRWLYRGGWDQPNSSTTKASRIYSSNYSVYS